MGKTARELLDQRKYDPLLATLAERLGADAAAELWVRSERRLDALLDQARSLPTAERVHVANYIYPTCALYLEMIEALGRDEAFGVLKAFAAQNACANRAPFETLTRMPGGSRLLIRAFGAVQPRAFGSAAGFEARQDPSSSAHVHFEITSCPYQRHTAELGVGELCSIFCTNDDIMYSDLPGVCFTRKRTLGRGADACDFDLALRSGRTEAPRHVLVVGVGVIGSYLTHVLCAAGHDVSVAARGHRADVIERDGLAIHHLLQRSDTVDHPRVLHALPVGERFDVVFACMRQDQMQACAAELALLDSPYVVCVGNDVRADEVERQILDGADGDRQVLFAFQGTAGHREEGRTVVVRAGAAHLTLGPLRGEADVAMHAFFEELFCGDYQVRFMHDMRWWLVCHALAVLPFCYVAYRLDCDLSRASTHDITDLTDAIREGHATCRAAGGMILPEGDDSFFEGPGRVAWELALRAFVRTPLARLCVTDHCQNAVVEMRALDEGVQELFAQVPDAAHPTWDALRATMPSWDELEARWAH